jgi:SAM-dependent methyltransferase
MIPGAAMVKKNTGSKELGLEIGLILCRYLLKTDDLHFGFWKDGEDVDLFHLPRAQENYSDFLLSHLPDGAERILDVGCGGGNLSRKLKSRGLLIDGVTPSRYLADQARAALGEGHTVHQCMYEDLVIDRRYDLILFSESFQYIRLEAALQKTVEFLVDGGHLLICDFFRTVDHRGPIGGGHRLDEFYEVLGRYPFEEVKNLDITPNTAPTLEIVDHVVKEVAVPISDLLGKYFQERHPLIAKLLRWKFRKKIDKWNRRYFSGAINAEAMTQYKSYRLLLYRLKTS